MDENKVPAKRYTVHVRAAAPLRYATHAAPFEREHPVASVAAPVPEEQAARDRSDATREDLFGGMM